MDTANKLAPGEKAIGNTVMLLPWINVQQGRHLCGPVMHTAGATKASDEITGCRRMEGLMLPQAKPQARAWEGRAGVMFR